MTKSIALIALPDIDELFKFNVACRNDKVESLNAALCKPLSLSLSGACNFKHWELPDALDLGDIDGI